MKGMIWHRYSGCYSECHKSSTLKSGHHALNTAANSSSLKLGVYLLAFISLNTLSATLVASNPAGPPQ